MSVFWHKDGKEAGRTAQGWRVHTLADYNPHPQNASHVLEEEEVSNGILYRNK
jgi:hypothetical protein